MQSRTMKRRQKELDELREECERKQKRIRVLEQEIEDHTLQKIYKKGGVLIFAGYDSRQEKLHNQMFLKWEIKYDFRRDGRYRGSFNVFNVRLLDESDIKYQFNSQNLEVMIIKDDISVEDKPNLFKCIDYDECDGSTTGFTFLRVFRQIPWTKEEMEMYDLVRKPDNSPSDETEDDEETETDDE